MRKVFRRLRASRTLGPCHHIAHPHLAGVAEGESLPVGTGGLVGAFVEQAFAREQAVHGRAGERMVDAVFACGVDESFDRERGVLGLERDEQLGDLGWQTPGLAAVGAGLGIQRLEPAVAVQAQPVAHRLDGDTGAPRAGDGVGAFGLLAQPGADLAAAQRQREQVKHNLARLDRNVTDAVPVEHDTTDDVNERELEGTFHGVPGTFECTDTSCLVVTDEDGNLETVGGRWTFTPDEAPEDSPHMVRGVIKDPEYMQFGYWLQGTEGEDGTTYEVSTFAGGSEFGDTSTVVGTASYAGPATGMFVKKTFDEGGVGTPSSSGQFTADANLKAHFGQDNDMMIAPGLLNSISGTVTNFMHGGQMIDEDWMVELMKADITMRGSSHESVQSEGDRSNQ